MTPCPLCGSPLTREPADTPVTVFVPNVGGMPYVETRLRPCTVLACSGCEYVVEVDPKSVKGDRP